MTDETIAGWLNRRIEAIGSPRTSEVVAALEELGAPVTGMTLRNWRNGDTLPRPAHLAALFEYFSVSEYERNQLRIVWMRQREAQAHTSEGAA